MLNKVIFAVLICFGWAAQSKELLKLFDGTAAYCPELPDFPNRKFDKIIHGTLSQDSLTLRAVSCKSGNWELDTELENFSFTGFNGAQVQEHYYNFFLLVASVDSTKFRKILLPGFETTSIIQIPLESLNLPGETTVDLIVMSDRDMKTSTGFEISEGLKWGALRYRSK